MSGKTDGNIQPGMRCPFTNATCTEYCWAWEFDGEGCHAFTMVPAYETPRDFYCRCCSEVDAS